MGRAAVQEVLGNLRHWVRGGRRGLPRRRPGRGQVQGQRGPHQKSPSAQGPGLAPGTDCSPQPGPRVISGCLRGTSPSLGATLGSFRLGQRPAQGRDSGNQVRATPHTARPLPGPPLLLLHSWTPLDSALPTATAGQGVEAAGVHVWKFSLPARGSPGLCEAPCEPRRRALCALYRRGSGAFSVFSWKGRFLSDFPISD